MSNLENEIKKCIKSIIKIEQDKQIEREKELDAFRGTLAVRCGFKKPRCYC